MNDVVRFVGSNALLPGADDFAILERLEELQGFLLGSRPGTEDCRGLR